MKVNYFYRPLVDGRYHYRLNTLTCTYTFVFSIEMVRWHDTSISECVSDIFYSKCVRSTYNYIKPRVQRHHFICGDKSVGKKQLFYIYI